MPRKERLKREKEKDLQQAAQGSISLLSWIKEKENEDERSEPRAESLKASILFDVHPLLGGLKNLKSCSHILFNEVNQ